MKIVIIKKDGSEEHTSYQEYAEKLSNTLHIKRTFEYEKETTPEQWMEFFSQKFKDDRRHCCYILENYGRVVGDEVANGH